MKSVWKRRGSFETKLSDYGRDYQVLVSETMEMLGLEFPKEAILTVRNVPIGPLLEQALDMAPDYDRHFGAGQIMLGELGIINKEIAQGPEYLTHFPSGWDYDKVCLLGFETNIKEISEAIKSGANVPPILIDDKGLLDGRHRLIAAVRIGRKTVPTVHVGEIEILK